MLGCSLYKSVNVKINTDHIVGKNAARQVLDVLVSRVDNFCHFLTIKQLLVNPEQYMLHKYVMLDHIVTNNLCYHRTPDIQKTHSDTLYYMQKMAYTHIVATYKIINNSVTFVTSNLVRKWGKIFHLKKRIPLGPEGTEARNKSGDWTTPTGELHTRLLFTTAAFKI